MKDHKLRIIWNSNASWASSGYSMQTAELLPLMRDEGYPVAAINYYGQAGGKFMLDGILQYPAINHTYGSDAMVMHGKDFQADVVFALLDQWVLHPSDLQQVNRYIPITPVDHDPCPQNILQNMRFAHRIITYSQFGHEQLKNNGLYSTYIPHTVNTEIFKPMDKVERKKAVGLPSDSFLIGMVAANKDNPPRKSFQEVLDAFKMFLEIEPKALLYIHTNPEFPGGFRVDRYAEFLGIRNKILFPDFYTMNFSTPKESMALIYNSFDVLVAPSTSEGFGVPLIEAQSCGVPVISHKWTSMTELVKDGETGYLVNSVAKKWYPNESYIAIPSTQEIFESLVKLRDGNRIDMGHKARKFITENYSTEKVFKEYWIPFLQQLEDEIYPVADKK